jgi:hypothetical protein
MCDMTNNCSAQLMCVMSHARLQVFQNSEPITVNLLVWCRIDR